MLAKPPLADQHAGVPPEVFRQLDLLLTGQIVSPPSPPPALPASPTPPDSSLGGHAPTRLEFVRNSRARRYVLRVRRDRVVRITIPRGGSEAMARRFAREKSDWIETQLARLDAEPLHPHPWQAGTLVFFRGVPEPLRRAPGGCCLGDRFIRLFDPDTDWRPAVEAHLRQLASLELPALVTAAAQSHGIPVVRITVRDQRSRWGSCSRRGTVSLNWRLVQTPPPVRDYIIAHELAHFRHMDHSRKFWQVVQSFHPGWQDAEHWLRRHGRELLR